MGRGSSAPGGPSSSQIVPKPLFDNRPVLERVYEVLGFDIGKIECDNNGCLVRKKEKVDKDMLNEMKADQGPVRLDSSS